MVELSPRWLLRGVPEIRAAVVGLAAANVALGFRLPPPRGRLAYEKERGTELWLLAPELLRRGRGDCEDLVGYELARLHQTGVRGAAPDIMRRGKLMHVRIRLPDGSIYDPSLALKP